jgi:hypothetical protein
MTPTRTFPVDRTLGWCLDCADLVPVEQLGDESHLAEELESAQRELARRRRRRLRQWLLRLLPGGRDDAAQAHNAVDELEFALALAQRRAGTERCLQCGSTRITAVDRANEQGTWIFEHPGCGGLLRPYETGFRLAVRFDEAHLYDIEGRRINHRPLLKLDRQSVEAMDRHLAQL